MSEEESNIITKSSYLQTVVCRICTGIKQRGKPLLFGQLISIILSASASSNDSLHFECNLSAPTLQAGLLYFCLMISVLVSNRIEKRRTNLSNQTGGYEHERGDEIQQLSSFELDNYDHEEIATNEKNNERRFRIHDFWKYLSQYACLREPIQGSLLLYFAMALLDVEANYFTFLSFRYTTLTSVSLLDAVTIPTSMLFSYLLLHRRYRWSHFLGAAICISGVAINVLRDYKYNDEATEEDDGAFENKFPNPMKGDILAVIGATFYGLSNVLTERTVKHVGGVKEYLITIGFFGSIISFIQGMIVDRDAVLDFFSQHNDECSASKGFGLLLLSVFFGVTAYVCISNFLSESEAAFLNISLLTGDLWVVAFSIVFQSILPSSEFWIALILIFIGVIVYELSSPILNDDEYDTSSATESTRRNRHTRQHDYGVTDQHLSALDMPDEFL